MLPRSRKEELMGEGKEYMYAGRRNLAGNRKPIDMGYAWRQVEGKGRPVREVADELGVSKGTLYRRLRECRKEERQETDGCDGR